MTNTNCLAGIRCPQCGNEDRFRIAGTTVFTVTDDGTEDHGDIEWDDASYAECTECLRHGTLKDFTVCGGVTGSGTVPDSSNLTSRFDDYQIHGMKRLPSCCGLEEEPVGFVINDCEQVPDAEAEFWSIFGHIPGQGPDCIGDFRTRQRAEEVYARITGRRYGSPA